MTGKQVTLKVKYRAFLIADEIIRESASHEERLEICDCGIAVHKSQGNEKVARLWKEARDFLEAITKHPDARIYAIGTADSDYDGEEDTDEPAEGQFMEKLVIELPDGLTPEMPDDLKKEIEEEYEGITSEAQSPKKGKTSEKSPGSPPPDIDDDLPF
ncbi:MAG: hypothetical protein R3E57_07315 [Porticoccaceae bacterium]